MTDHHIEIARQVREAIGAENLLFHAHSFWRWRERGVWARIEDRELQKAVHAVLDVTRGAKFTKATVDSTLDLLRTESYRSEHRFNVLGDVINTASGLLLWNEALRDWSLQPHRREDYLSVQVPIAYIPAARCLRFSQFLKEIFEGDPDAADKGLVVLELLGYSLLAHCRYERFVLLIGEGSNGKTVLLKVVEALLGPEMVAAVQPSQFDNRFQRAHLAGKLANIVTEIAEGAEIADAALKAIVSGELTTAEHKHKPPFDFHPFATCWFATNHMPHTRDFSDALFRRAIVLSFNRRFEGPQCDPLLADKLRAELPGILNLALAAIRGVILRGSFTEAASSIAAKREWQLQCDQAAQFFEDRCVPIAGERVGSTNLYKDYRTWAEEQGINRTLSQKTLLKRLQVRFRLQAGRDMHHRFLEGLALRYVFGGPNVVDLGLRGRGRERDT